MVTTRSGIRLSGRAAGVRSVGTSVMLSTPVKGVPCWFISVPALTKTDAPGMAAVVTIVSCCGLIVTPFSYQCRQKDRPVDDVVEADG